MEKDVGEPFEEESDAEFEAHRTVLDAFRRVQGHMIAQNLAIFKQQRLKLHGKDIDLSEHIQRMQNETRVWGGWSDRQYKSSKRKLKEQLAVQDAQTPPKFKTIIYTKSNDCVDETLLQKTRANAAEGEKVLLMNLASRSHVCGRWESPYLGTQEETIERRSAVYRHALDPNLNPHLLQQEIDTNDGVRPESHMPEFGCITTCGVPIVRRVNFHLTTDIQFIDVVACGAIDLRVVQHFRWGEREKYMGSPLWGQLDKAMFCRHTKRKMRITLLAAAVGQWTHLVLGAFGCGAYGNPPDLVVKCWQEVLQEPIFARRFKVIVFSILGDVAAPFFQAFGQEPRIENL